MKSGRLNLQEPSGPHWAYYGTALTAINSYVENTYITVYYCTLQLYRTQIMTATSVGK
jgi:hypothetical protein